MAVEGNQREKSQAPTPGAGSITRTVSPAPGWRNVGLRIALLVVVVALSNGLLFWWIIPEQKLVYLENLESKGRGVAVSLQQVAASSLVTEDYSTVVDHCKLVFEGDRAIVYLVLTRNDGFSLINERAKWSSENLDNSWRPNSRSPQGRIQVVTLPAGAKGAELGKRVFGYSMPFSYSGIDWGWIHVGLSLATYDKDVQRMHQRTFLLAIVCNLPILGVALWLMRRKRVPETIRPLVLPPLSSQNLTPREPSGEVVGIAPSVPDHVLLRCIAKGSYGEVWIARNSLGAYRAVKVVRRNTFSDPRPYERELAGIRRFEPISRQHEGVVDILQVGSNDEAGYFYYVMELADDVNARPEATDTGTSKAEWDVGNYRARTLSHEIRERGRLPASEALPMSIALAEGLQYLHTKGLVHRDIKPSNIIFVAGRPKLADVGLVAELGDPQSLVGTAGFIAPEGPGSAQADIYSLGKVIYEAVTGKDRQEFPELPTTLGTGTGEALLLELNEVALKACAHKAAERYKSASEMLADLKVLQSGQSLRGARLSRKRWRFLLGSAGILVAMVVIGGFIWKASHFNALNTAQTESTLPNTSESTSSVPTRVVPARAPDKAGKITAVPQKSNPETLTNVAGSTVQTGSIPLLPAPPPPKPPSALPFSTRGKESSTVTASSAAKVLPNPNSADRILAAHIVKIAGLCQWPASVAPRTNRPLVIGVVGTDTFAACVRHEASGLKEGTCPLEIRDIQQIEDATNCHMLCVTTQPIPIQDFLQRWHRYKEAVRDRPVLLVTDISRRLGVGAVIEFGLINRTLNERTLGFEVDLDEANRRQLQLSPVLLRSALQVLHNDKRSPVSSTKTGGP